MLVLLMVLALTFPVMRALAGRVERSDGEPVDKLHRLQLTSLGLTFGLLLLFGAAAIELHLEKGVLPGPSRLIPAILFLAVAIALPVFLQIAVRPTYERLRGIAGTTRHVRRRTLRGVLVMLLPQLVWFGVIVGLHVAHASAGIRLAALLAWFVFLASCGPLLVRLALPTRSPDARIRDLMNSMCDELGVRIRDVRVIDTSHNPMANAVFSGFGPGPKYLFVTDKLLDNFDDDEVRAVLAHEIGHRVKHHIAVKLGALVAGMVLIGGILAGLAAFGGDLPHVAVIAVALLPIVVIVSLLVVQGAVGIKLEQQADDYAASVVGADEMRRALQKLAEQNMMKLRTGRLWNIMSQHPGMEERIQRLRDRTNSEQPSRV